MRGEPEPIPCGSSRASSVIATTNGHSLSLMQPMCMIDEQNISSQENMHPEVC